MAELASGHLAVRALRQAGVEHLFTLSGGHIFPLYDGCRHEGVRLLDTRHEQAAVFAAEGLAKLTRRPQVAALTAGPGVSNGVSAVATARFGGSPLLVIGGRAPQATWGQGSLQEVDHVAFMGPLTKHAVTSSSPEAVAGDVLHALRLAATPQRGPAFVDIPLDVVYAPAEEASVPAWREPERVEPDPDAVTAAAAVLGEAQRPALVAGTDVWLSGAVQELRTLVEVSRFPVALNGMGRGCLPPDHELVFASARGAMLSEADVVCVVGTPLDFRLGFGRFGDAKVVHVVEHPDQAGRHAQPVAVVTGDLPLALAGLTAAMDGPTGEVAAARQAFVQRLRAVEEGRRVEERDLLEAEGEPIHPARVYGALRKVLDHDAVVIGDGGDFVSFAGRFVTSHKPGRWLDPGPYGCLGTGMGYAMAARLAHPDAQVVALLGDGAAGFGLMDADSLVRHGLPAVMVVGNNGMWALEKFPMRQIYGGWDAAADLRPGTRYDEVVRALGGAGETVERPSDLVPALRRAFDLGVPYLVNVLTDPDIPYPRTTPLA